jgi:nicotinate dehydrogenase subunit B
VAEARSGGFGAGPVKVANAYLADAFAEGWEAPPLTSLSHAPIPWSEDALYA